MTITMLEDLLGHKAHSDSALLTAIELNEAASQDSELLKLAHHILIANRFWLSLALAEPFSFQDEIRQPETIEEIVKRFRETESKEREWISQADQAALEKEVETPFLPGKKFSVAQGMMQVCMHSHWHRAQCWMRLKELGVKAPGSEFVTWLKERPAPVWP
jgi:uncharacterized damage-inducible protein DinB